MSQFTSPLKHLNIAAPCTADWEEMSSFEGDRVRYCSECKLNVYNLSEMKRREAEALILRAEGRLCVRFYRRADGSVMTRNCPIGLRAMKAKMSWTAQFIIGMLLGVIANIGFLSLKDRLSPPPADFLVGMVAPPTMRYSQKPIEDIRLTLGQGRGEAVMGDILGLPEVNVPLQEGETLKFSTEKLQTKRVR